MRSPLPIALALAIANAGSGAAARPPDVVMSWSDLLTRDEVGATAWTKAHPTWDGRGVVVAVLDTGVDPSVPGLRGLPQGGVKVIETRDFSGEGDVLLRRPIASRDAGVDVLRLDAEDAQPAVVVRGHAQHVGSAAGRVWLGAFSERVLSGSDVSDIDRDGRKDGRFAVLVVDKDEREGGPVAIVDTDGDGDLGDEQARRSYRSDPRWFVFGRPADPLANRAPVAVTLTIDLDQKKVELHFDDGGHGTHCAGIAAGHRVEDKDGFDGVAPGAWIMSLKIGHNALTGGATTAGSMTKALRYASRWARDHKVPVVVNLSYGIGSEQEGMSDIDKILDDELAHNPWLAVSTSAGNEGPGLSSVGSPAAATLAWASAAMLTEGQARTLFGGNVKGRKLFAFSSRGGELDKPDGLAPGTAWATVPPFERSAVKAGTSMAAPQAAGVHALLASAALAERLPWTNGLAHRALATGARPIAGYSSLDQGAGLIDTTRAWDAYRTEARLDGAALVAGWRVKTPLPTAPGRTGAVSYWRTGRFLPSPTEALTFTVTPILYMDAPEDARAGHVDVVHLASDVGWLAPDRGTLPLRGTGATDIVVRLDSAELAGRPGLHIGRVRGTLRGVHAFDLPVVVIVPEPLAPDTWSHAFASKIQPGDIVRVFVQVPPGATAMTASLAVRSKAGSAWLLPFRPDGQHTEMWEHSANAETEETAALVVAGQDLTRGTWELVVYAPYRNRGPVEVALDVDFRAVEMASDIEYNITEAGRAEADLTLTNRLDGPFRGDVEVRAIGMTKESEVEVKAAVGTRTIELGPAVGSAVLELEVDERTYARMTDIAVTVRDEGGAVVAATAFGRRKERLTIDSGPGRYTIVFTAALADPDDAKPWKYTVRERHLWKAPRVFDVSPPSGMSRPTLLPDVPVTFTLGADGGLPELPDEFGHEAEVTLTARDGTTWQRLTAALRKP